MVTFDTNVIVRVLVKDDPAQSAIALRQWRIALEGEGVFLPKVVLAETIWVLRQGYGFQRPAIQDAIGALVYTEGLTVEDESEVQAALADFGQGSADFSDYLILASARAAAALPVHSFDRRFARVDGVSLLAQPGPGGSPH